MSDTPIPTLTDVDRNQLFATWLKPIKPANARHETIVEKLAPWRHQFADAIAAGYTWSQLAEEIATKSEIGIKISAEHLRKCIHVAFKAAGEAMPGQPKAKRRCRRRDSTGQAGAPVLAAAVTK